MFYGEGKLFNSISTIKYIFILLDCEKCFPADTYAINKINCLK